MYIVIKVYASHGLVVRLVACVSLTLQNANAAGVMRTVSRYLQDYSTLDTNNIKLQCKCMYNVCCVSMSYTRSTEIALSESKEGIYIQRI